MYTPCLPLTRPDECVHVAGQYMKQITSTPKSGGGGGRGGKRKERDLRCNSFTNQLKSKGISVQPNISQIWHVITQVKNPATKTRWQSNMFSW